MEVAALSEWSVVSEGFPFCVDDLRVRAAARPTAGGPGSVDPVVCIVSGCGRLAGGGVRAVELLSPSCSSVTTWFAPAPSCNLGDLLFCRWSKPGSSSLSPVGGRVDLVVPRRSSSSSCWYGETESDDFPSAWSSPEKRRVQAPGGSGTGDAAARPCSASEVEDDGVSWDLVVFSSFLRECVVSPCL